MILKNPKNGPNYHQINLPKKAKDYERLLRLLIEETNTFCSVNKKISDEVKVQIKSWRKKWESTCDILLAAITEIQSSGAPMGGDLRDISRSRGAGQGNLYIEEGLMNQGQVFYETVGGFRDEERGVHRRVRSLTPPDYRKQLRGTYEDDGGDLAD